MFARLFLTTALLTTASIAPAQELPNPEELSRIVAGGLPPYWAAENFEVVVTSRSGDAATPGALVRFEVDGVAQSDLFAESGREGPFVLVVPTEAAQTRRRLYGVQDLTYRAGQWSGEVTIENPVDGLGQPKDLFDTPTLVLGDEQTGARLAALRDTAIAGTAARQEAEIARLGAAHEKAMADLEAAQASRLATLRSDGTKALSALDAEVAEALVGAQAEGVRSVAAAREEYETQLAALTEGNEPAVAQARAERVTVLSAEQATTQAALSAARDAAAQEFDVLRAEHGLCCTDRLKAELPLYPQAAQMTSAVTGIPRVRKRFRMAMRT